MSKVAYNRVVHSSHFWVIFDSFWSHFQSHFSKMNLKMRSRMIQKWPFLENRTLDSLSQKWSFSGSFLFPFLFVNLNSAACTRTTSIPHSLLSLLLLPAPSHATTSHSHVLMLYQWQRATAISSTTTKSTTMTTISNTVATLGLETDASALVCFFLLI